MVGGVGQRRVVVDFPESLYRETERAIAEMQTNRSNFIRLAVERFIENRKRRELERELAEGYMANSGQLREVEQDLSFSGEDGF